METVSTEVATCEVFPITIEGKFEEIIKALDRLSQLIHSVSSYNESSIDLEKPTKPDELTSEALEQYIKKSDDQIKEYEKEMDELEKTRTQYEKKQSKVLKEVNKINELAQQIVEFKSYDPECTLIDSKNMKNEVNDIFEKTPELPKEIQRSLLY
ncbi:MAG: hypothetical protein WAM18_16610, partial [Halobacillus sp.]|uniref:hypothetical protein n=1 Tax=Halobacillus sp. TaxID=56800 RepID=UPI003BB21DCF